MVLNEARLTGDPADGGLGYDIEQLAAIALLFVPFSGLEDMDVQAGETVITAPSNRPIWEPRTNLRCVHRGLSDCYG